MKFIVYVLLPCLTIWSFKSHGQEVEDFYISHAIQTINASSEDFSDLEFLRETLKDNRIVLLGEQSHGEGATFEAKVRLVKFLHQELNFDIVSFESGLFDNYKAFESITDTSYLESPLKESIFSMWSDTKEFEPLLEYVHKKKFSPRPLVVTGFDSQTGHLFKETFLHDLKSALKDVVLLNENELNILDEVVSGGPEFIVTNEVDSALFFSTCLKMKHGLEQIVDFDNNIQVKILRQALVGWVEMVKWEMDVLNGVPVKVQNPRDLQMAQNLIFLSELYPEKKIIGWGASYHFANQIELYRNTDLTKSYISKLDSVHKSEEPTDIDSDLAGAIPMGRILKDHFRSKVYSMSFSSFDGAFGMLGSNPTDLKAIEPPPGSIEYHLATTNNAYAFIDYRVRKDEGYFYSSVLGNLPLFAPWTKIFDGLFFIKKSYPPSFPFSNVSSLDGSLEDSKINRNHTSQKVSVKRVIDNKTKHGIGYANVYLANSSHGVASNGDGEFVFNLPHGKANDRIVFSSIGYKTDTLSFHEFVKLDSVQLTSISMELPEIVVNSKPLHAKEIIKLAEKKITQNYYQNANQQEFFYRVKQYKEDSVVFNEEAAVLVFSPAGYKSSTNAAKKLKGRILQFRNTTNNRESKEMWGGVGSLWLMYTHDLILDKDNVLHRPGYYDLVLNGITEYENRRVYEISFDCKKPGAYTTGFGYPAPVSASGKIFIEVNTHSVLKIETLIQRRSFKSKRFPNVIIDPYGHQLIQSYKEYEGKYFLNYSKQVYFSNWVNTQKNSSVRQLEIRELLSTHITTNPVESFTVPLTNIKSVKTAEDDNFWINHNLKIEDNVEDSYDFFGLIKKQ